jgi:ATP-dependent exoDNAse (exonuclease V) beta subunit
MQSIYRFRKAEVALFLRAQRHGINRDLPLQCLTLTRNFRSQAGIVTWLNQHFPKIFPPQADVVYSAVPYVHAEATKAELPLAAAQCHLLVSDNDDGDSDRLEAQNVLRLTQQALQASDGEIAILVRARSHLRHIIPALQRAQLAYTAVDIASLADAPLIGDLQQLTRAVWHLGDRLAWLTVLRAPWCGLLAADLYALCGRDHHLTVYEQLQRADLAALSDDGRQRFARVWPVLQHAMQQQDALSLPQRVEACWRGLHGLAVLQNDNERADVEQFFRKLYGSDFSDGDVLQHIDALTDNLYAQSDSSARVKLMTMHKSKGLEFDTVIVPGLNKRSGQDSVSLLAWDDYLDDERELLLIGPYEHRAEQGSGMIRYLRAREKIRADRQTREARRVRRRSCL